jgi:putative toxin-antitoxin system antitoxin component (TIGR02293 family)
MLLRKINADKGEKTLFSRRDAELFFRALTENTEPGDVVGALSKKYNIAIIKPVGLKGAFLVIQKWPLRKSHLEFIAKKFGLKKQQAAAIAGVSKSTYHRWKSSKDLSSSAAESIFKLAEVYDSGLLVFDKDEESFMAWLNSSVPSVGYDKPTELLDTRTGMELVNDELLRLEYGVL